MENITSLNYLHLFPNEEIRLSFLTTCIFSGSMLFHPVKHLGAFCLEYFIPEHWVNGKLIWPVELVLLLQNKQEPLQQIIIPPFCFHLRNFKKCPVKFSKRELPYSWLCTSSIMNFPVESRYLFFKVLDFKAGSSSRKKNIL